MEIAGGKVTQVSSVAILPGSFHPPTVAHLGLAQAALARVGLVVFTLPRAFPHKSYGSVGLDARLELLSHLTASEPRFAVAISDGGLFIDMAREWRRLHPATDELFLLCGRDAAERIVSWPYPPGDSIEKQLSEYALLVASRDGDYRPPADLGRRIETLAARWDDVSSTRVRHALAGGEDWCKLVPAAVHDHVARIYAKAAGAR